MSNGYFKNSKLDLHLIMLIAYFFCKDYTPKQTYFFLKTLLRTKLNIKTVQRYYNKFRKTLGNFAAKD